MFPFTRHGWREMFVGSLVLAAIGFGLGWWIPWLSLIVLPVWVWLFAFFRDPERPVTAPAGAMVSPADGVVSDVTHLDHHELLGGPCMRVGIFLSVFNVHVNRAPCDGKVVAVHYKKGKFINAMSHSKASDENESNTIVLADVASGRPVAVVKQIVGLIARRIICTSAEGDVVERGGRIGMIKFGSRTELYIPDWLGPQVTVSVGQKVCGNLTTIATLKNPVGAATKP